MASPPGEKLSAKRTDEGRADRGLSFVGCCGRLAPHPPSVGASGTFPQGGRHSYRVVRRGGIYPSREVCASGSARGRHKCLPYRPTGRRVLSVTLRAGHARPLQGSGLNQTWNNSAISCSFSWEPMTQSLPVTSGPQVRISCSPGTMSNSYQVSPPSTMPLARRIMP